MGVIGKSAYNEEAMKLVGEDFSAASTLSIGVGAVVFFISFLGCYGAARENRCMLYSVCASEGVSQAIRGMKL